MFFKSNIRLRIATEMRVSFLDYCIYMYKKNHFALYLLNVVQVLGQGWLSEKKKNKIEEDVVLRVNVQAAPKREILSRYIYLIYIRIQVWGRSGVKICLRHKNSSIELKI